ncbi:hypothetical protein [Niabella hirudinis]|uniref:hypothetical protein n=1 Tax=Niabella hirudinis TaxID=1285929 RepID=UPI003EBEBE4A
MNKRFLLSIVGAFMVFIATAQNCINMTSAVFSNPSGDNSTWNLDIGYNTNGNKSLSVKIYCGGVLILEDCLQGNTSDGHKTYTGVMCNAGLSALRAEFIPYTGNCGAAQCGSSSVVIGGGPLSAAFESITAVKANDQIKINWTTASEINSKEFVVEGSRDNVNWTAIGKLDSKAVDGNSTGPLNYTLTIGLPVAMAALGMGGLFLLTLVRSRWARVLALVVIVLAAGACLKDGKSVDVEKGEVGYVRIAQYDKDSQIPTYSKIIKVVND